MRREIPVHLYLIVSPVIRLDGKKDGKEENENKEREERKEREKKEFITKELHIQSITYQLVHILHKHLLNL